MNPENEEKRTEAQEELDRQLKQLQESGGKPKRSPQDQKELQRKIKSGEIKDPDAGEDEIPDDEPEEKGALSPRTKVGVDVLFERISEDVLATVQAGLDRYVRTKVKKLEARIEEVRPVEIQVISPDEIIRHRPEGVQHYNFGLLLATVIAGQPSMLVGPAGTGKSHAGEMVAKVLDTEFYAMSVGAQTSKSDLIGYMSATGSYVSTAFRKAYEEGGVFLLDEIDAGNSNVLIQLNAALANGYMSFPDRMVRRHEKFRFIASANTFGLGANRQYVGRNQLDAATLDRFVTIEWDIDPEVEKFLGVGHWAPAWLKVVHMVREYVTKQELRILVSPRATQRGSLLLAHGVDFNHVLHMALLGQFQADVKQDLHNKAHVLWREEKAKLGPEPKRAPKPKPERGPASTELHEKLTDAPAPDLVDEELDKLLDESIEEEKQLDESIEEEKQLDAKDIYLLAFGDIVTSDYDEGIASVAKLAYATFDESMKQKNLLSVYSKLSAQQSVTDIEKIIVRYSFDELIEVPALIRDDVETALA